MILKDPFKISSRLLPSVEIDKGQSISIEPVYVTEEGRTRFKYYIDALNLEYSNHDIKSQVGGCGIQEVMENLLGFLGAAADSYGYHLRTGDEGENEDLFPPSVTQWAYKNRDKIEMIRLFLEENPNLIQNER